MPAWLVDKTRRRYPLFYLCSTNRRSPMKQAIS